MKISIKKEFASNIDENDIKKFLNLIKFNGNYSIKIKQKNEIDIRFKGKIEKNFKSFIPFIIKASCYKKILEKRGLFFKSCLIGIDSILLPEDFINIKEILKSADFIPYEGLKKGFDAYLKLKSIEEVVFMLINNLKEKNSKNFSIFFITYLLKNFTIKYFTIKNSDPYIYYVISFKKSNEFSSLESFALFLESLAKAIYVEKNNLNRL